MSVTPILSRARSSVAGAAVLLTAALGLAAAPAAAQDRAATAVATFAGGCFWCIEADLEKLEGVLSVAAGYTESKTANPSYKEVSAGVTGHAEAVRVLFDPAVISFDELLGHFWRSIDPTAKDRQFCDVGRQYRSAIFYHDEAQREAAERSRSELEQSKPFREPIVTEITAATAFYPAEASHQDYAKKNPIRYRYYRNGCGRDQRLEQLWGGMR